MMKAIERPFNPNRGTSAIPSNSPPKLDAKYEAASPLCLLVYNGIAEAAIHGDCKTSHNKNARSNHVSTGSLPRVHAEKTDGPSNQSEAETATQPATVANTISRNAKRSFRLSCI